jgi:very-short-patch-repair endonuclease
VLPRVFTRAEALAVGFSVEQIDAFVRSGHWTPLRRAVYAETARLPAAAAERHAAEIAASSRATKHPVVGSHESAAIVHALSTFTTYEGPPVLSRRRETGRPRPNGTTAASLVSQVPDAHVVQVYGADVTSVARTAVDLARKGPALSAVVVLDAALRAGVGREALEEVARSAAGWPGIRQVRQRIEFADGRAETALESVSRWRMYELGLPKPDLQRVIRDRLGFIGRVDFYFEELRVIGEADGMQKYRLASDDDEEDNPLGREKVREDRFRDAGYEVFRWDWDIAVRRPAVLAERARRAFARALLRRSAA